MKFSFDKKTGLILVPITIFVDRFYGINFPRQKDLLISFKNGEIELK